MILFSLIEHFALETWAIILESAKWLLLGFLIAGILRSTIPAGLIEKHLRRPGLLSVLKASLFGIPLPLCSCSVIPVGAALRRKGASRGATASFLISTPEIGVDSILMSYALLGPMLTLLRTIAAFLSAFLAGILIDRYTPSDADSSREKKTASDHSTSHESCCARKDGEVARETHPTGNLVNRIITSGFQDTVADLAISLPVGYLLAGFVSVAVPSDFFHTAGIGPIGTTILMLFAALPLYVCATASTPIAAGLMAKGLFPGAVIVFLLAGPASNVATMVFVSSELGMRALVIYIGSIAIVSLLAAWLVSLAPGLFLFHYETSAAHSHASVSSLDLFSAFALIFLLLSALYARTKRSSSPL